MTDIQTAIARAREMAEERFPEGEILDVLDFDHQVGVMVGFDDIKRRFSARFEVEGVGTLEDRISECLSTIASRTLNFRRNNTGTAAQPPCRIFIGWDPRQVLSYEVLVHSIITRASAPVAITPLIIDQLPTEREGLTPFTYSRFLVPWLCNYEGYALFLDSDELILGDICEIFLHADDHFALKVVQNKQHRFEWPSVMLFNNAKCHMLRPEYVEMADKLHVINWLPDTMIGGLPPAWNHLVGYDQPNPGAKLVHFTQGVPAWPETEDVEFAAEWKAEAAKLTHIESWAELMGKSVHAQPVVDRLYRDDKVTDEVKALIEKGRQEVA